MKVERELLAERGERRACAVEPALGLEQVIALRVPVRTRGDGLRLELRDRDFEPRDIGLERHAALADLVVPRERAIELDARGLRGDARLCDLRVERSNLGLKLLVPLRQ